MNPKFTHVAFLVSDVDKTADFFNSYCNLKTLHKRTDPKTGLQVVWIGIDLNFVIVAFEGEKSPIQSEVKPLSHLGFSLDSKEEVDKIADKAKSEGILNYGPIFFDPVVGYICEILDPDGNSIEFSYGQELGRKHLYE